MAQLTRIQGDVLRARDQMTERHLKRDVMGPVVLAQEHRRLAFRGRDIHLATDAFDRAALVLQRSAHRQDTRLHHGKRVRLGLVLPRVGSVSARF